jgi:hypothetical protein
MTHGAIFHFDYQVIAIHHDNFTFLNRALLARRSSGRAGLRLHLGTDDGRETEHSDSKNPASFAPMIHLFFSFLI